MTPPSYPMRPLNGGPLDRARPKLFPDRWIYEPKFNGWRAIVHTPTGRMFNRKLEPLSIEHEFADALHTLKNSFAPEWLDCEALERRHGLGRGSLIVLDYIPRPGDRSTLAERLEGLRNILDYEGRRNSRFVPFRVDTPPPNDSVLLCLDRYFDTMDADTLRSYPEDPSPAAAWQHLQDLNRQFGCEFYEGLVAKRTDSPYTLQLRSPDEASTHWIKHRWEF